MPARGATGPAAVLAGAGCFVSCSSSARLSSTQKARPWVATTTSPWRVSMRDVAHLDVGQVERQRLPVAAAVEARRTPCSWCPRRGGARSCGSWRSAKTYWSAGSPSVIAVQVRAVVRRLVHVGREVVPHVAARGQVRGALGHVRRLDRADVGLASAGPAASPHASRRRRPWSREPGHHRSRPRSRVRPAARRPATTRWGRSPRPTGPDRSARPSALCRRPVVSRQIRADRLPGLPVVVALHDVLRADEQLLRVRRREQDRMGPREPVLQLP